MTRIRDREIVRCLAGGLDAAAAAELRRKIEADPAAARRLAAWEHAWTGLALPPPGPVPASFSLGVRRRLAEARAETATGLRPLWVRAVATAALLAGLGLGSLLGFALSGRHEVEVVGLWGEPALTELSWTAGNGEGAP
jgi:anti-sigma factor RsiW